MDFKVNRPAMNDNDSNHEAAFDRLPTHLQAAIFQHLDLVERMKLRLVSQSWNKVVLDSTQLTLTIDASEFNSDDNSQIFALFRLRQKTGCFNNGVDCSGISPNELINRLPQPLMNRVFNISLTLGPECNEAKSLLSSLASRIERTCTLSLGSDRLPLSVLTSTQQANATVAEEFPWLLLEKIFAIDCDFDEIGNNLLSYFGGSNATKRCEEVNLTIRAQPSNELLQLVVEGYPSTTELAFDFYHPIVGSNNNRRSRSLRRRQTQPNSPDWTRLTELRSLRDLTILATADAGIQLPVLSPERRFGQLASLAICNAMLPLTSDFFRFTPQMERIELKRNHDDRSSLEIKKIAMDIRSGHLKKLKFAKFCIDSAPQQASFDSLQLLLKSIVEGSSATDEPITICWSDFDTVSVNNEPCLVTLLNQLPAGFFNRRPVTLMLTDSDIFRASLLGLDFAVIAGLPSIIAAIRRSGLHQLSIRTAFESTASIINIWAVLIALPSTEVTNVSFTTPHPIDDDEELWPSFTDKQPGVNRMTLTHAFGVNGSEQNKLELVQITE